jgi:hypothetical protein
LDSPLLSTPYLTDYPCNHYLRDYLRLRNPESMSSGFTVIKQEKHEDDAEPRAGTLR